MAGLKSGTDWSQVTSMDLESTDLTEKEWGAAWRPWMSWGSERLKEASASLASFTVEEFDWKDCLTGLVRLGVGLFVSLIQLISHPSRKPSLLQKQWSTWSLTRDLSCSLVGHWFWLEESSREIPDDANVMVDVDSNRKALKSKKQEIVGIKRQWGFLL